MMIMYKWKLWHIGNGYIAEGYSETEEDARYDAKHTLEDFRNQKDENGYSLMEDNFKIDIEQYNY